MVPIQRLDNGNIELTLTFPWTEIQAAYNQAVDAAVAEAEITGFRKGKAPRNLVEPKLNQNDLYSQALQQLFPPAYNQAIKDHSIKPIIQPRITLTAAQPEKDWQALAVTCELPVVTLPKDYAEEAKKQHPDDKTPDKLVPVLKYLHQAAQVKIPDLLVEEEANHRLSALADNLTRLDLTIDKYLDTKKLTLENLKAQTSTSSRLDLETEFILEHIRTDRQLADRKATLDFLQSLV